MRTEETPKRWQAVPQAATDDLLMGTMPSEMSRTALRIKRFQGLLEATAISRVVGHHKRQMAETPSAT